MRWYKAAAELGHAEAAWQLGIEYAVGTRIDREPTEAVHWYRVAAEQGYVAALESLAKAYATSFGVAQDSKTAEYCYRLAEANPDAPLDS